MSDEQIEQEAKKKRQSLGSGIGGAEMSIWWEMIDCATRHGVRGQVLSLSELLSRNGVSPAVSLIWAAGITPPNGMNALRLAMSMLIKHEHAEKGQGMSRLRDQCSQERVLHPRDLSLLSCGQLSSLGTWSKIGWVIQEQIRHFMEALLWRLRKD